MSFIARVRGRARGIFYGWWILASFNALTFYANGTLYYGFTAFFNPIAREMGWSRAAVAAGASLFRLEGGELFAPLVGFVFDRVGARRLMMMGAVVVGIGFLVLSQVQSLWQYYLAFTILALGFTFNFSTVMVPVLANWFHRKSGLAFGIQAAGNAVGGILVPLWPLLIGQYGWRNTLIFIGIASWVYCIPLTLVTRQRPEDMGLRPDGSPREAVVAAAPSAPGEPRGARRVLEGRSFTVPQVLRLWSFWLACAALTIWSAVINAMTVHLIPALTDRAFSTTAAALAVTGLTLTSILSRLGFGRLADTFDARYLIAVCFLSMAAGLAVLTFVSGPLLIPLFILAFFPAYGGVIPLRSQMLVDYYGRKAFPLLQGVFLMVTTIGGTLGPVFAGRVFDVSGSYTIAFVTFIVLSIVGIPLILAVQPPGGEPAGKRDAGLASAR